MPAVRHDESSTTVIDRLGRREAATGFGQTVAVSPDNEGIIFGNEPDCILQRIRFFYSAQMVVVMDAASLKEKAALCLRIAGRLSWNNPGRLQLATLAQRYDQQAKEAEMQVRLGLQDGP